MSDSGSGPIDPGDGSGLDGILEGVEQAIIDALNWLWAQLDSLYEWILSELEALLSWLIGVVDQIIAALEHIWKWLAENVIYPLIGRIQALLQWLKQIFQPILNILNRIRMWYN